MVDVLNRDPYFWGTGRRKTSVARVRIKPGTGKIVINDRAIDAYFMTLQERWVAVEVLQETNMDKKWDVWAKIEGGGRMSQSGAFRLGVARALFKADPGLERQLKQSGYLSRDPRRKERKKFGLHGARRGVQFSKR